MIELDKYKGTFPWVEEIIKELEECRVEHKKLFDACNKFLLDMHFHYPETYENFAYLILDNGFYDAIAEAGAKYSGPSKAGEQEKI